MKKKIILVLVVLASIISATAAIMILQTKRDDGDVLTQENEDTQEDATTKPDQRENVGSVIDYIIDISNPSVMAEHSDYIALVKIDSIDGANNYSEIAQGYVKPYTYGRMTIIAGYKGELEEGQSYVFYRLGGTLPAEQYYTGSLSPEGNAKRQEMQAAAGESDEGKYIHDLAQGDVEPEVGKSYLVYLVPEDSYYGKPETYAITGAQGGLREVRQMDDRWQVLNNFTGEWENLEAVVNL